MSFSKIRAPDAAAVADETRSAPEQERSALASSRPDAPRGLARASMGMLFVTVFLDLVGFGIVIPLLPLYAERFGAGAVTVTSLVAVYSLMQFLVAPWWGRLSDRVGRRPVLLVGLFGSAASYLLFGLAGSLAMLFVGRILAGVAGATVGVAQAYVADVTGPHDRARGMGMIGAAFGLGFIFGPALGGLLARYGASTPFFAAAALAAINGLVASRWLAESLTRSGDAVESHGAGLGARWRTFLRVRGTTGMAALIAAFFLLTLAFAALEATLSLWGDRRWTLSPSEVAFLFAYLGLLVTIVQGGMVGPMSRRLGDRRLAVFGLATLALGLTGIAVAPSLAALAGALALLALGQGCASPALSSLIAGAAAPAERGQVLGVAQSLSALGRVIGPIGGGLALSRIGLPAPFLSAAVLAFVGAGVLLASPAPGEQG